ncbi:MULTISPECIES: SDR family oxidoreductase [unclassified Aureispira]|uniref:SDR family oxidoreductase n=1 Tax=unclassified Aureispira TaxID=2649989 RepID=UPI000695C81A|nr:MULTISPECIES: SDR family oxidoreductase [unclassified Aureispira]WMX17176.1 SDR family oxidoreductase [Aureispira sp. CCB-E]
MKTKQVLLAGGTGYLGGYVLQELLQKGHRTRAIVRSLKKINTQHPLLELKEGQVTQKESLKGICEGIDVVISTVGITRQKDGLTYMDVDYQANLNLLEEAKRAGVQKFIYVSAINGDALRDLKIFEAKERFVDALKESGLAYVVLRPNGFFSDMKDFLKMAKNGRVYLFGDGNCQLNPIHGADLAEVCVTSIGKSTREVVVGGPDLFTQNELAELALEAWGNKVKIVHLPDWIRRGIIFIMRTFTSSKTYGPIEFFLTAMAVDNIAPKYGQKRLKYFFEQEVSNIK